MPRIIFKCRYLKNAPKEHLSNFVKYVATREGVEKVTDGSQNFHATKKQQQLIRQILQELPDSADLFEYEDYQKSPTRENASEFISIALENNLDLIGKKKNFVDYIAHRPKVEKLGSHGLFTDDGVPIVLSQVAEEVSNHPGNVWTHVVSLRRTDAARLGYDCAKSWQALIRAQRNVIAQNMKIAPDNLKWYAAFHNEGHHPHIHLIAYSSDPKEAYVTKQGIENMRGSLAQEIFRQDLLQIYEKQTERRNILNKQSHEAMQQILSQINSGICENKNIEELIVRLSEKLKNTTGKKQYGYLKAPLKAIVDQVVDELAKDERVAKLYSSWYEMRNEVLSTYADKLPPPLPLSQQKEFKSIKNMVISEALNLGNHHFTFEPDEDEKGLLEDHDDRTDATEDTSPAVEESPSANKELEIPLEDPMDFVSNSSEEASSKDDSQEFKYHIDWSEKYKEAREFLYGTDDKEPHFEEAYRLFMEEAETGNVLAIYDLGRMHMDGLGVEMDRVAAQEWYTKALNGFLEIESKKSSPYLQYRIGKMYMQGLGTEQDYLEAADWFHMAVTENYKYAQYSLAGLYYHGKGVDQSYETAFDLYKKSAQQKNPYASYELAKMYRDGVGTEKNPERADEHFQKAFAGFLELEAQSRDDKLQYRLGQMLYTGTGTEQDTAAAIAYFEKAARLGNVNAQYMLGKIYLKTDSEHGNIEKALQWLGKAADNGNALAQYAMAKLYLKGDHVEKDIQKAIDLLTKSAEQKNSYAQYALGKLYLLGEEVPKDIETAIRWLTASADQNNQFAQYTLGKLYLQGKETAKDIPAAIRRLTASAEQGNQYAQYMLGKLYLSGEDITKDISKAEKWLIASAEQDNQYAQYLLGKLYLSGEDVPKDIKNAVRWLKASAQQGNQFAQYQLGKLCLSGEGLPKDVLAAIRWFTASAEQGNQYAQYMLGKLYLLGRDVERDKEIAEHWLSQSAAQGNIYAQFFLERIDNFKDPSVLLCATRLMHHLSRMFQEEYRSMGGSPLQQVDRKLRRKLMEKKSAQGHAYDDHAPHQSY